MKHLMSAFVVEGNATLRTQHINLSFTKCCVHFGHHQTESQHTWKRTPRWRPPLHS